MRIPVISFRSLVTLTLSIACVILAVMWPGWFTELRAQGYTPQTGLPGAQNLADTAETEVSKDIKRRLKKRRDELGLFLNGLGSFGDQQATSREPGFDFHTVGFTLGGDYGLTDKLILGAAFGYLQTKAKFDTAGNHLTTNGYSLSTYGSYFVTDEMYLDGIATYGWNSYDLTRNIAVPGINETAKGDTDGIQLALSVGGGYNFTFGPLTAGPTARVNYRRVHVDRYQERGAPTSNSKVNSQNVESLTTDFGGQVYYAISMPWGVLSPLVRFEWEHEFENDSRTITGRSIANPAITFATRTNNPDRDYLNLGGGFVATLRGGASAFAYYETVLWHNNVTNHSFTVGVRFTFE